LTTKICDKVNWGNMHSSLYDQGSIGTMKYKWSLMFWTVMNV
jgi:hypothetical protein